MSEFNFDNLKNIWKEQQITHKYTDEQIIELLHNRSRNNVKYILWIGLIEFSLFLIMVVLHIFTDSKEGVGEIINTLQISNNSEIQGYLENIFFLIKAISLVVTGIFVILFYIYYKAIKIESKLSAFIQQLLGFRRVVRLFVWINISISTLFTISCIGILYNSVYNHTSSHIILFFFISAIVSILFTISFTWLYYRVVYGIILRKLNKYLKHLQDIEQQFKN